MSKRFAGTVLLWLALTIIVTGLMSVAPLLGGGFGHGFWLDAAAVAGITAFGGLASAGLLYLGYMARSQRSLRLAPEELGEGEQLLKQTQFPIVRRRAGAAWRVWENQAGGKLFLTNSRLIFRAHAGQPWRDPMEVRLEEVIGAERCRAAGFPDGLMIRLADGTQEVFGCGLESVDAWASAITALRARDEGRASPD